MNLSLMKNILVIHGISQNNMNPYEIYPEPKESIVSWKQAFIFIVVLALVLFCIDRIIGVMVSV